MSATQDALTALFHGMDADVVALGQKAVQVQTTLNELRRAAYVDGGFREADNFELALPVEKLYVDLKQRLHEVGLSLLFGARTTPAAEGTGGAWVPWWTNRIQKFVP